jgi:hypothetical protein
MLRFVYHWLLRLHPTRFRDRFAEEMLAIFDDAAEEQTKVALLTDGFVSLVRQWTLRSEYWEPKAIVSAPSSPDVVPLFYTFERFKPRTSALIDGGILTVIVFYAVCLILRYTWTHPVLMPFRGVQFQTSSTVNQSGSYSTLPVAVTSINSGQQFISPEFARKSSKVVLPASGSPASPQSGTQAALSDRLAHERLRIAVSPHPIMSPVISSASQSSVRTILPPKVSEETLRSYAGMYAADPPNQLAIFITAEDGQLAVEVGGEPKCALVPASGTRFVVSGATNTSIEFVKDHDRAGYQLNICQDGRHITAHYKKN